MLKKWFIKLNNVLASRRRRKVVPENVLLLLPYCMQWNGCPQNVRDDIVNCKKCGKCRIGEMKACAERYGIRCFVAGGGRRAVEEVRRSSTHAVVAVACEKELVMGIFAALPKRVLAISNTRPEGYCCNTSVDLASVEAAIRLLLHTPGSIQEGRASACPQVSE